MSESYLIEKKYMGHAIRRAFIDGGDVSGNTDRLDNYVKETLDEMLRGDKPFNEVELFNEGYRKGLAGLERDEFAVIAMPHILKSIIKEESLNPHQKIEMIASASYEIADAMIAERAK